MGVVFVQTILLEFEGKILDRNGPDSSRGADLIQKLT